MHWNSAVGFIVCLQLMGTEDVIFLLPTTLYKKVQHFNSWIETVGLELLESTVKKDC